ncbi:unnamed protein product [Acanthoscelides obtectus]|uniref:Uncharacterized protein n=1 Tax=Acanthoscelides obtectus TaxID=200917 RepID=A0A9P0P6Q2_ACAOB|nr:unnamed protein product [Acanthoscelides obtectus]CAK1657552.1 hypothetical protein AOBTE_LOCUS20413 [Acanthoscelides obtectus]
MLVGHNFLLQVDSDVETYGTTTQTWQRVDLITHGSSQQDRVYSISERVQPNEWSSRDAYLTVQHITAENQMNKPNYNDAPPSYEEAMRIVALTTATGESSTVVTVSTLPKEPN